MYDPQTDEDQAKKSKHTPMSEELWEELNACARLRETRLSDEQGRTVRVPAAAFVREAVRAACAEERRLERKARRVAAGVS